MNRDFELIKDQQLIDDFTSTYEWLLETATEQSNPAETSSVSDIVLKYIKQHIIKPQRGTKKSAGYDIHTPFGFELAPGEDIKISTGLKAYMLDDEYLDVRPRSGSGFKYYVRLANTTGIIDSDYYSNPKTDGHIWVKIRNEGDKNWVVNAGEAVCQGIFHKYLITDSDNPGGDRSGGFGSTGK